MTMNSTAITSHIECNIFKKCIGFHLKDEILHINDINAYPFIL